MAESQPDEGIQERATPKQLVEPATGDGTVREVEYHFTLSDLLAIMDYHAEHPPGGAAKRSSLWWAVPAVLVLLGALGLVIILARPEKVGLGAAITGAALLMLAVLVFRRRINRMFARRAVRRQPHLFERQRVALTPNHIRNEVGTITNTVRWEGVGKIIVADDYAFIYLSLINAIVVPRRAFASSEAFDKFIGIARRYQRLSAPTVRDEAEGTHS